MSKYYCSGCQQIIERDWNGKTYSSYCDTIEKKVVLKKLELIPISELSIFKPKKHIDFVWTDKLVLEFNKISTSGSYGIYSDCKSIKSKLKKFKEINKSLK